MNAPTIDPPRRWQRASRTAAAACLSFAALVSCEGMNSRSTTQAPSSPGAAPVLSAEALIARPVRAKAPLGESAEIVPLEPARVTNRSDSADLSVSEIVLDAHFEWPNHARLLRLLGVGSAEAQAILGRTQQRFTVTLQTDGRLEMQLLTPAFPLAEGSRIQSRYENFGHFLVWPDASQHRVLRTGTLRALLREHRVDATPILTAQPTKRPSDRRFGVPTEDLLFDAAFGKLNLKIASVEEAGKGGPLLCRLLLEFLAIAPQSEVCAAGKVPVAARFDFSGGGGLLFVVDNLTRRTEGVRHLEIPPTESQLVTIGLPAAAAEYLTASELEHTSRATESGALRAANPSPYAAFLVVDGVPLGLLLPRSRGALKGLSAGTYSVGLRTLFGEEVSATAPVTISARAPGVVLERADAGF